MKPEKQAEIELAKWLMKSDKVKNVFFNNDKNELGFSSFSIKGKTKEKPDFILECFLFGRREYIAIEIKSSKLGMANVFGSNKILEKYYSNYINKKTKYFIGDKEIKIKKFLIATENSPHGNLLFGEDKLVRNGYWHNRDFKKWANKIVPEWEFMRTKDFRSQLTNNFKFYRETHKEENLTESGIGILISDSVLKIEQDGFMELGIDFITKLGEGNPLIQGIFYNPNTERWQQCLVKL